MDNRKNFIQLVFPYLDYGLNYNLETKNDVTKFEDIFRLNDFIDLIEPGKIIPNFLIKIFDKNENNSEKIRIRELLNKKFDNKSNYILFNFIDKFYLLIKNKKNILNKNLTIKIDSIFKMLENKIMENKINLQIILFEIDSIGK